MGSCSQISEIVPLLEKWVENSEDQITSELVAWTWSLFEDAKIQNVAIFVTIETKNILLR